MDKNFFSNNRKKLQSVTDENSIVIMYSGRAPQKSADEYYKFTPNRNFYYMLGIDRENIIYLSAKCGSRTKEYLFIEENDPFLARWVGDKISKEEAGRISGVEEIVYLKDFEEILNRFLNSGKYDTVYFDLERREYTDLRTREQDTAHELVQKYPFIRIKNLYKHIERFRMIKEEYEIEETCKAIEITNKGIKALMENAKSGIHEYELEAHFDYVLKINGVKDYAFPTIAASGSNAAVLHYDRNDCIIEDNTMILFDLGAQYKYYNADISRTFPVSGKFTPRQRELYDLVLKAELEVIGIIRPGIPHSSLNQKAREVLGKGLIALGVIKSESELSEYYFHGVSHFLGLDTHDVGTTDTELKPGMIMTVEPGLYMREEGIGIRIEDNVLVTETGCRVLSENIIKTADDIEKFMKKSEN